jgi:hypothetical protein
MGKTLTTDEPSAQSLCQVSLFEQLAQLMGQKYIYLQGNTTTETHLIQQIHC